MKTCKNKEVFNLIKENRLKKALKLLGKNKDCYKSHSYSYHLLKGYIAFFEGEIKKSLISLNKANQIKKSQKLVKLISRLKTPDTSTLKAVAILRKEKKENSNTIHSTGTKQQYYTNQYRNSADILLEKLQKLEKLYKSGKISKQEYMEEKYKIINQF
ncbi:hypothetical protein TTHT_2124 [Thermotomaculum hydrothermale]|uniref:Uncharacterized protein n=1 Tax=Thermotomaculum hydrothermale TaxID=981385 RepID=A0A7R6PGY1_9BACT|nr:hypothetical protein [Thermotomaculum hydrothermale]BBB33558.1 hypothetical protein TTHT_2124 [Thermotomaculum hydrothermale]